MACIDQKMSIYFNGKKYILIKNISYACTYNAKLFTIKQSRTLKSWVSTLAGVAGIKVPHHWDELMIHVL